MLQCAVFLIARTPHPQYIGGMDEVRITKRKEIETFLDSLEFGEVLTARHFGGECMADIVDGDLEVGHRYICVTKNTSSTDVTMTALYEDVKVVKVTFNGGDVMGVALKRKSKLSYPLAVNIETKSGDLVMDVYPVDVDVIAGLWQPLGGK